jgi:hypothetical protein
MATGEIYRTRTTCPSFAFFFLHTCTAWPVGVLGLAVSSSLVKAGVSLHLSAGIIAALASMGRRNTCVENIRWGFPLQCLSRSGIQFPGHNIQLSLANS